jgi:hypothetical protein
MITLIMVYHNGLVIANEIDSYVFVEMKKGTFLLNEFPTLQNLVGLVRERLGWMDEGFEVCFKGQIDIGLSNDPQMKMMPPVFNEKEWTTYVGVVMKLEIREIEMAARMIGQNDAGDESSRSPTLPEAVDEKGIECDVVLTQPSQETQYNTDAKEPPSLAVMK